MSLRRAYVLSSLGWALGSSGCVEIDPSYGESYSTSSEPTSATSIASATSIDASTGPDDDDSSSVSGDPGCACGPWELCEGGACTPPTRILYINLDGATTTFGPADASMNSQNLYEEFEASFAGYSPDAGPREALMDAITAQWAPFGVLVTGQRPDPSVTTPYMMAVVTADPPPAGFEGVAWVAFPDCGDGITRDVAFVFNAPGDGFSAQEHANAVSGAIAQTFGLQRTGSSDDITGFGGQFVDACIPRSQDPPCAAHDPQLCGGDATQQNSYRELAALLGLRG